MSYYYTRENIEQAIMADEADQAIIYHPICSHTPDPYWEDGSYAWSVIQSSAYDTGRTCAEVQRDELIDSGIDPTIVDHWLDHWTEPDTPHA